MSDAARCADREFIRDLLYRYCRAVDRRDLELLKSCYHDDGFDQHASFMGSGHAFAEYGMREMKAAIFTQHRLSNILIEFDGDRAFSESYVHSIHRIAAEDKLLDFQHFGRYCDLLEKRDGVWKISYRLHLPDADSVAEIEEPPGRASLPPGAPSPFVRGEPGPGDPSYATFDLAKFRRDTPAIVGMFTKHVENWLAAHR